MLPTCQFVPQEETPKGIVYRCEQCGRLTPALKIDARRISQPCRAVVPKTEQVIEQPTLPQKAQHYAQSTSDWMKAGKPVRTDEEVDAIAEICMQCDYFFKGTCTHKNCGCGVKSTQQEKQSLIGQIFGAAMVNKIRRATEHCPIDKW